MKYLKSLIYYLNIIATIASVLCAGLSFFIIAITCCWSSDTNIAFRANPWYVGSILIGVLCLTLSVVSKKRYIVYCGNIVISIFFLIAEYFIKLNPYSTRPEWFVCVDLMPLFLAVIGLIFHVKDNGSAILTKQ
ncbi:MAG: hypothetical protein J6A61_02135 [Clostridia bacterium]|nr:hypothetical protein [Clostridia bacterium]